jgi:hypothetical protein
MRGEGTAHEHHTLTYRAADACAAEQERDERQRLLRVQADEKNDLMLVEKFR